MKRLVKGVLCPLVVWIAENVLRWRIDGEAPDLPKFIFITEPHTSNLDILFMFFWACKMRRQVHWVGKKELFSWPVLGSFCYWTGGIPVDRSSPLSALKTIIRAVREREEMLLLVAPSGTRAYTDGWKPGFHYLARKTGLPMVPAGPDMATRRVVIGEMIHPSEDVAADIERMRPFFEALTPVNPDRAGPVRLLPTDEKREKVPV